MNLNTIPRQSVKFIEDLSNIDESIDVADNFL